MDRYLKFYKTICETEKISSIKGWLYLLYYPIMKEIDSMLRHIQHGKNISSYDMELVDEFYYDFCLFDDKLPTIAKKDFLLILNEADFFVPSPIKEYACGIEDFKNKRLLINYHDASPCFSYCGERFQLESSFQPVLISDEEKDIAFRFLMKQIINCKIVHNDIIAPLKEILYQYLERASRMFPTISQWIYPLMEHYYGDVLTDQTLAPGQCCVNHLLKLSGHKITVLQHQKNLLLTDLFPILFLDFHLADRYFSWISRDQLFYNYPYYHFSFPDTIIQRGAIDFKKQSSNFVADKIGFGKKCLYILTSRDKKFINGTMLDINSIDNIKKDVEVLRELNFEVYIREDPRIINKLWGNINVDKSSSLIEAIDQYDVCFCDRPGGATIVVLERTGFVFIKLDLQEFKKTQTCKNLLRKQKIVFDCLPVARRKLFDMFNLLYS